MIKTYSAALVGVSVEEVEIETAMGSGFSGLCLIGLPNEVVRDMRERVRAALEAAGYGIPARRVVVNVRFQSNVKLVRSQLSALDFAIAAGIIRAIVENDENETTDSYAAETKHFFFGELELGGALRLSCHPLVVRQLLLRYPDGVFFVAPNFQKLGRTCAHLSDWVAVRDDKSLNESVSLENQSLKSDEVVQSQPKRLARICTTIEGLRSHPQLLIASLLSAAGRHHLLLAGEPGIGKSYTARKLAALLPPLRTQEHIDVQIIYDGVSTHHDASTRPFRSPHHSLSMAGLVGGAQLKPGEMTLAHHGVLFLDEFAEFSRTAIEALREPLDAGAVSLSRAAGHVEYPAKFVLLAATNPCPCGYALSRKRLCRCLPGTKMKYQQKLSGPILDRFAMKIFVTKPSSHSTTQLDWLYQNFLRKPCNTESFAIEFAAVQDLLWFDSLQHEKIEIIRKSEVSRRSEENENLLAHTVLRLFPSEETRHRLPAILEELNNMPNLLHLAML